MEDGKVSNSKDSADFCASAQKDVQNEFSKEPAGSPIQPCSEDPKSKKEPEPLPPGLHASQDEAARAALNDANPKSIADNREYGGLIYRDDKGRYGYTTPIMGSDQGVNPYDASVPPNTQIVGDYHTHGDYSIFDPKTGAAVRTSDPLKDHFNSDNFSSDDLLGIQKDGAKIDGYKGYLGTPSGQFKVYDPSTGKTSNL